MKQKKGLLWLLIGGLTIGLAAAAWFVLFR